MEQDVYYCAHCGEQLTEANTHEAETTSGFPLYCTDCEEKSYSVLEKANGAHFALFLSCARFDVPCEPSCVESDFGTEQFSGREPRPWLYYLRRLTGTIKYAEKRKPFCFKSGVTSFLKIFGKNLTEKDFAAYVRNEMKNASEKGTEEQIERWGKEPPGKGIVMNAETYNELDRQYFNRRETYAGQTITPQMEDTLIKVTKWNICIDRYIRDGETETAQKLLKMVDSLLASEQMRKADEKPVEHFRPDAWIDAFQKKGYMDGKDFVSKEEMIKAICRETKRKKYNYSVDAVHQFMLNVVNNARKNSDLPTVTALSKDMFIEDDTEFEKKESAAEKKAKKECGLSTVQFFDEDAGGDD